MPLILECDMLDENSFWPGTGPVDTSDIGLHAPGTRPPVCAAELGTRWTRLPWRMDLCRDSTLSIRRRDEAPFNGVARPVAYARRLEDLRLVQGMLCGRPDLPGDPRLTYEGGVRHFIGMWVPGTQWQLSAVMRVLMMFLEHDQSQAAKECLRLSRLVQDARDKLIATGAGA